MKACSFCGRQSFARQVIAVWMCAVFLVLPLRANPVGENVAAGAAAFDRSGSTLSITTSDQVTIDWQNFSINSGELTRFIQPSVSSVALNRVVTANPSLIYGSLQANGQVFLINPNGILVGPGGKIDCAGGFVGSTLNVSNNDFLSRNDLNFLGPSAAGIQNQGTIRAAGGDVFLIARTVENTGQIQAPNGVVGLAATAGGWQAGNEVLLTQAGTPRMFVKLSDQSSVTSPATLTAGRDQSPVGINNAGVIAAAQSATGNGSLSFKTGSAQTGASSTCDNFAQVIFYSYLG